MYLLCHLISSFHCLQRITKKKMLVFLSSNNIYLFYYLFPKFLHFFSRLSPIRLVVVIFFNKRIKIRPLFYITDRNSTKNLSLQRPCNFLKIPSLFEHDEIEIELIINFTTFFPLLLHPPKQSIDNYTVDLLNSSCDNDPPRLQISAGRSDKLYYALRRMHDGYANKNINFSGSLVKRAGVQLASSLSFAICIRGGGAHRYPTQGNILDPRAC